jgi:hypothetical protein
MHPALSTPRETNPGKIERWLDGVGIVLLAVILLAVGPGCQSSKGGSGAFAAITIHDSSTSQVRETVMTVFGEKGFYDASRPGSWFLDRPTSKMGRLMHGGWFDADGVRERVKLRLIPLSDGAYRIECTAVMVRDAGDAFFEEETRMTGLKSGPYEQLLEEVERRLRIAE